MARLRRDGPHACVFPGGGLEWLWPSSLGSIWGKDSAAAKGQGKQEPSLSKASLGARHPHTGSYSHQDSHCKCLHREFSLCNNNKTLPAICLLYPNKATKSLSVNNLGAGKMAQLISACHVSVRTQVQSPRTHVKSITINSNKPKASHNR